MFVDGFLDLYREGILKRRVEPDGALLHGAFLLGPRKFYEELRTMPDAERSLFRMMPVSFTNELLGPAWETKMAQRRDARFINTAMMATLGGALVSDGLADGRVVSGVGGQYNFVAQAHELPGGRSIVAVRSTRTSGSALESNIRWNYGHVTIPRHLRDVVLTEYGIAEIRGKSDAEVAAAMLDIADSRFQPALLAEAQRAGKLPANHRIADANRRNLPEALEQALAPHRAAGRFDALPYGTDLSAEEIKLGRALRGLKARAETLARKARASPPHLRSPCRAMRPQRHCSSAWVSRSRAGFASGSCAGWSPLRSVEGDHPSCSLSASPSVPRGREQAVDHGFRLRAVGTAEQVQVIQHVIEVVELAASAGTRVQRKLRVIRGIECRSEAPEQARHGDIRLAIAVVDRRIENDRRAVGEPRAIAAPKVAVQQRRLRLVAAEERIDEFGQAAAAILQAAGVTIPRREIELEPETALTPERRPLRIPAVRLLGRADGIVALETETGSGDAVQPGELATEARLG